jgi:hypothetical protein
MLDQSWSTGRPRLMTPEQRDALVAAGKHVVATGYPAWRFASIDPHAEIARCFGGADSLEDARRRYGGPRTWPYFARMAAQWVSYVAGGDDEACRCCLCGRSIAARADLGRIVFAWPDEPDFPEENRASVIVCARCAARPDYRERAAELSRDLTQLVLVTTAEGTA